MITIPPKLSLDDLVKEVRSYASHDEVTIIKLAYDFADAAHKGQMRKTGEPYISHPLAVAYILATMRIEPNIVTAALLHDVPEDTAVTLEEVEKNFGKDIAGMVKGITKLSTLKYRGVERYIENLRKMFVAMAEDIRVMLIKFADRTHNLLTLEAHTQDKKYRIALESLEIYAPIANRLGMGEFKAMLEDLSFPYIYPKEYEKTKDVHDKVIIGQEKYLEITMEKIRAELRASNIKFYNVHGREKQLYSLYQKLLKKGWKTENIHDIVALRVIVPDIGDCYAALGALHRLWKPLKGRVKDYIAQPKPNGYRSLHTTVFADEGKAVEFQIRTQEMHEDAEYGIAAHWHYDENGRLLPNRSLDWAKELAQMQKDILKNISDLDEMKVDFFQNRIFVFTPQGDVIDLPENACPIDFAYHIHTEIGNKCNGAKVNDQLVSLDTPLKNGDVIEIITDKNRKGPSQDWMRIARTHTAKIHIRNALNLNRKHWLAAILPKKKN
ncbi:MAG: RelA/SpoT family protein [bacterium]|nr:RelA/SpoT family protein [bacterium]